ncbi:hypothetical protein MJ575_21535 [Klebsiella pneumoniae]|nr:hypothetical protein MJ575_21535 [Klebsiella pneumoniae]
MEITNNEKQNVSSRCSLPLVLAPAAMGGRTWARMFVRLKDWDQRDPQPAPPLPLLNAPPKRLIRLTKRGLSPAACRRSAASAVRQLDMELEDHAGKGHDALMAARDTLLELAGKIRC